MKSPLKKIGKVEKDTAGNIIAILKGVIKEQSTNTEKSITELKESINFITADIQNLKGKMEHTKKKKQLVKWRRSK